MAFKCTSISRGAPKRLRGKEFVKTIEFLMLLAEQNHS